MIYTSAIILAAGKGRRFKSRISKALVSLARLPLVIHCLRRLSGHREIKEIILVANRRNISALHKAVKKFNISKIKNIVLGGLRRQDSVLCGLKAVSPGADLVLVHDAARPFINKKIVSEAIKKAHACGAAVAAVPVKATIKEVRSGYVKKTLERSRLYEAQTPQVFKKSLITRAYKNFARFSVTDDAMLVEKLGVKVGVVSGSPYNIKITTAEDLFVATAISRSKACRYV